MALLRTPPPPRPSTFSAPSSDKLLASSQQVVAPTSQRLKRLVQPWQGEAFGYYDTIGEIHYAGQFYARALAKLRLYVAREDADGERDPLEAGEQGYDLIDRVQDRGGGRSVLLSKYGQLMFICGETYLTVTQEDDGEEVWECLSPAELRFDSSARIFYRVRAPGLTPEEYMNAEDEAFTRGTRYETEGSPTQRSAWVSRLWKQHPQYSEVADSSMRGVLGLCQQLLLLEAAVTARTKSRIAQAGILLIAQELMLGSANQKRSDNPLSDPFREMLQKVMTEAIQQPGSAAGVVPIVIDAPSELIKEKAAMAKLDLHDPLSTYPEEALRAEDIRRIAQGLDLPPEMLLGMTDANHWTAWQIDDQTWSAHLEPVAQQLVDDLTSAYLRPMAKEEGIPDWDKLVVDFDAAAVINNPDRSKDAVELFDRGAIGYKSLRDAKGFNDKDAQTEDEHAEYLAIKLRDPALVSEDGETMDADEAAAPSNGGPPGTKQDTIQEEPEEDSQELLDSGQEMAASAYSSLVEEIAGAASLAVIRARELAGSRLVTKVNRSKNDCEDCTDKIDKVPQAMVASALGMDVLVAQGWPNPGALVSGGAQTFNIWLRAKGFTPQAAGKLSRLVEGHAAKHLFIRDPEALPQGFRAEVEKLVRA